MSISQESESKFERAFRLLKERIQFMIDKDKLSDKQIEFYNDVLRMFQDSNEELEGEIFDLQVKLHNKEMELAREKRRHEGHAFQLEAIILAHGIIDVNSWLRKGVKWCADEVAQTKDEGSFILPAAFRDENLLNVWRSKNPKKEQIV
jgi:hypothetical protein